MTDYTPTPWTVRKSDGGVIIYGGDTIHLTRVESLLHSDEQNWANAEHIVHAVNAHDELVYRCQVLYRELGGSTEEIGDVGLTALRLGIVEMFERIGMPGAEAGES